jgi:hypothetical protein
VAIADEFRFEQAGEVAETFLKRRKSVRNRSENGIALITTLLILLLVSSMIVGIGWLVMGDQKLGGNMNDRQLAYYGAEAGMEELTASLTNAFDANYSLDATAINGLMTNPGPPANLPQVQYLAPGNTTNGSGYVIAFTPSSANANLPSTSWGTIPTGAQYAGLVGLMTPYTLTVTAHTLGGSEVKLEREVQTVGIPVFQFGMFSQTDLAFFAGPDFNFGGRVHSNGNLWLTEGGNTLTLSGTTTAAGNVITSNLENGWPTSSNYGTAVDITTGSGTANLYAQTPSQSVANPPPTNWFGSVNGYNSAFGTMATGTYNGNLQVGGMGVQPLNIAIATPAIGGQSIDLIRRPVTGEATTNASKYAERDYSQVSLRILLSDYGSDGTCGTSDISSTSAVALPGLATNGTGNTATPVNLATLAWDTSNTTGNSNVSGASPPYKNAPAGLTAAQVGVTIFPLPVSYAQAASYSTSDGYWVKSEYPTITGCLKIDMQTNSSPPTWTDVTWDILNYGFTGRNIDPQIGGALVPAWSSPRVTPVGAEPSLSTLSSNGASQKEQVAGSGPLATTAAALTVGCFDPSPSAIIKLARLRDNPSTALGTGVNHNNYCGNNPSSGGSGKWYTSGKNETALTCTTAGSTPSCPSQYGTDYWPNVLFDTREALLQDPGSPMGANVNNKLPVAGAMYYVELDVANLASWFLNDATGSTAFNGTGTENANGAGYSVYFSDRRSEQLDDQNPPASVSPTGAAALTGGFGWEDNVNFVNNVSAANGCPNGRLDQGEDVESDYNNGVSENTSSTLKTYGNILNPPVGTAPTMLWPVVVGGTITGTQLGTVSALTSSVLSNNPNCTSQGKNWPLAAQPQDLRENPPIFFRRALKIVNGSTINITGWKTCNSVPCGLTIVSENPVYLQGDYNNPGLNTGFTGTGVGAAVIADSFTWLSDDWNDVNSFAWPYLSVVANWDGREVFHNVTYRLAVASGKGIPFENTNGTIYQDFGTDGGAHNFLRQLEDWNGNTLYYEGSIVSMWYSHQGVGIYKCCNNVYNPPSRGYQFDNNFLTPNDLPPLTPMLRVVNTIGATQVIIPTE